MKRTFALICVVLLIAALFAGCGNKGTTPAATDAPAATQAPATQAPATKAPATQAPAATEAPAETEAPAATPEPEPDSPYHFAKGNFKTDADGLAAEKYDYELPLTTTDEVLTYWMTCYVSQYLPEGGFAELPLPTEVQNRTGVHMEYVVIDPSALRENFGVLLASDDLCDITCGARSYYPGIFKDAILEEEYFINVYDYKDYCPNFIYEVVKDPEDKDTIRSIFTEKNLITSFICLNADPKLTEGPFCRGDWLKKVGMNQEDIITFDDLHDLLKAFQVECGCAHPFTLFQNLEVGGCASFVGYDTYCTTSGLYYVVRDGKVYLANTESNDLKMVTLLYNWVKEGIMDPNWASYSGFTDIDAMLDDGTLGYCIDGGVAMGTHNARLPAGTDPWVPLHKPTEFKDQVLHLGFKTSRVGWGSAAVSTKCENIELACTWIDWHYGEEGSFLYGYGVQGISWDYNEDGDIRITDFIATHPAYYGMIMTVYSLNHLCDPGLRIDYSMKMDINADVPGNVAFFESQPHDNACYYPSTITYTKEQTEELDQYRNDIQTFISEHYLMFVDGSAPLSEWDNYRSELDAIGLGNLLSVVQEAYDDFMAE